MNTPETPGENDADAPIPKKFVDFDFGFDPGEWDPAWDERHEPKPEELTCFKCPHRETCEYVDDPYNTDGDCLASK